MLGVGSNRSRVTRLRGEPTIAQGYAERCLAISEQHGFRHWLGLSRAIRDICPAMLDASTGRLDEVKTSLEEYQRAGYQLGLTAQFVASGPLNRMGLAESGGV